MSSLDEPVGWELETGFTEEEAYALLSGKPLITPLVAAGEQVHTGAMIALVPSDADLERLAEYASEPIDELHLTLAYLGEAAQIPEETRQQIIDTSVQYFNDPLSTEAFSVNVFNPHNPEMDTALVLGIKGEMLEGPRSNVVSAVRGLFTMPEQHAPWIPHVTMAYTDDLNSGLALTACLGPITFDKLRFAFGGEVTDVQLDAPMIAAFWNKNKHPRDNDGRFRDVPGGGVPSYYNPQPSDDEDDYYDASPSKHGGNALNAARGTSSFNAQQQESAELYQHSGDYDVNAPLREFPNEPLEFKRQQQVLDDLDAMMSESRLTEDVEVLRGISNPQKVFGENWRPGGGNEGLTWRDHGFASTTTDHIIAEYFAADRNPGDAVLMRIKAPKGTPALHMDSGPLGKQQAELLLNRGLTYRVVKDHGREPVFSNETGAMAIIHRLDVEVVPSPLTAASLPGSPNVKQQAAAGDKLYFVDDGPEVEVIKMGALTASLGIDWETFDVSQLPPHLKAYWLGPKGSARVGGWGNEGSYRACVREMRKEGVPGRMIHGLCANLYHEATGHTPNQKKIKALTADGYVNEMSDAVPTAPVEEIPSYAPWEGVLTLEGVESGDGRLFSLGSLDWAQLPLPLMYQPANTGGHSGAVLVGQITNVVRKNNRLYGYGIIDLKAKSTDGFEVGKEVYRLMSEEFLNGVSVDVDKVKDADVELVYGTTPGELPTPGSKPKMTIFHRGRVRGATLVAFPAFVEAQIFLTGDMLTASAAGITEIVEDDAEAYARAEFVLIATARGGWSDLPIADDGHEWDKGAAIQRLVAWAGDDISGKYARAFLYKDGDGDPNLQGTYKFPIADIIGGKLTIVPNAVRNAGARLEDSDIPASDKASIRSTLDGILKRIHGDANSAVLTAAGHTITIPDLPPAWWFDEPKDVQMKGALTVTDEGRVYGLLAPKNTTHRAVKTKVPTKNVDYTRFMGRETIVAGGGRVVTGVITMNCGHAPTQNYGTLEDRIEHYDNSCSVVANVRIGETADGSVWVAGSTAPFVTAEQVSRMLSCTLSGDWQAHPDRPGVREFIAALLVPVPGFAMARTAASVQRYEDGELVASYIPVEFAGDDADLDPEIVEGLLVAGARKKGMIADRLLREFNARKLELAKKLGRTGQDVV